MGMKITNMQERPSVDFSTLKIGDTFVDARFSFGLVFMKTEDNKVVILGRQNSSNDLDTGLYWTDISPTSKVIPVILTSTLEYKEIV